MEPDPLLPEGEPPPQEPAPVSETPPAREPFWWYSDVLTFIGMAVPCMLIAFVFLPWVAQMDAQKHPWQLGPARGGFYFLVPGVLAAIFRFQYDRPLWRSLGWVPMRIPPAWALVAGLLTAIAISLVGVLIQVPAKDNPMTKLLSSPGVAIPVAIFGVTMAPLM